MAMGFPRFKLQICTAEGSYVIEQQRYCMQTLDIGSVVAVVGCNIFVYVQI